MFDVESGLKNKHTIVYLVDCIQAPVMDHLLEEITHCCTIGDHIVANIRNVTPSALEPLKYLEYITHSNSLSKHIISYFLKDLNLYFFNYLQISWLKMR